MTATCQTLQCLICGGALTMNAAEAEHRCTDPAHWLAAGLLAQDDFYQMARLMAAGRTSRPLSVGRDTAGPAQPPETAPWLSVVAGSSDKMNQKDTKTARYSLFSSFLALLTALR